MVKKSAMTYNGSWVRIWVNRLGQHLQTSFIHHLWTILYAKDIIILFASRVQLYIQVYIVELLKHILMNVMTLRQWPVENKNIKFQVRIYSNYVF